MAASFAEPPVTDLVRVDVVAQGRTVRVITAGEVDSSSAPVLESHLAGVFEESLDELVVDLCGVTFLDSAGLCVLAAAHRRAGEKRVTMRVLASSRAVVRPLQITGLWQLLGAEHVESTSVDQSVA
ncbi:STAS domain-containing protein [Blastococcus goldschmidtiae]|uniref:Anti-sigma factor antagonist n=1 Tax=Blastococcus goldschmidtiae TaxID=3075546 RepID=A0ABU2K8T7_9ACTN|nr:STAS domain-containing protein [Blastococcus sp. DSM 46792]MDT0276599.1 STAS domain-containing protein [Blastococcus sp. DSM 46792]